MLHKKVTQISNLRHRMKKERPYVLSIAGLDPSAGAGVLADIKTFEANKVYGMGAASALTYQNENEFDGVKWLSADEILRQCELLQRAYRFPYVKIGLIENFAVLEILVNYLTTDVIPVEIAKFIKRPAVKIIWDPILSASAGFDFHKNIDTEKVKSICTKIFLITPNTKEIRTLMNEPDEIKAATELSRYCHVFLKGGHSEKVKGKDLLFTKEGKQFSFNPKKKKVFEKHGSGCVLSSAITAQLANGFKLNGACLRGKRYTEEFLLSTKELLGYHK